jgi:hypothetical protein
LTTEQKQAKREYDATRRERKKESKKLATVPFSAVPGFKLTKRQRNICRCIRANLRRGGAKRNFRLEPHMGWFRAFIEGGGEHAVPRETQEQRETRLSKQRERSARNRAVRPSQQKSICREQDHIRQTLRRSHIDETEKIGILEVRFAELSPRGHHVWTRESAEQRVDRMQRDASSKRLSRARKREEGKMFKEMDEVKMRAE